MYNSPSVFMVRFSVRSIFVEGTLKSSITIIVLMNPALNRRTLSVWVRVDLVLRLQYTPYEVLYKSGMFLEVFRFAKKMKSFIKGEIRCTLFISWFFYIVSVGSDWAN